MRFFGWFRRSVPVVVVGIPKAATIKKALEALEAQEDIAAHLLKHNCKLPRQYEHLSRECPVAQYVSRAVGFPVAGSWHSFMSIDTPDSADTPRRVRQFIQEFDSHTLHSELREGGL